MLKKTEMKLLEFIDKSPCSYQAVKNITDELKENGYTELYEHENWKLVSGGRYFITKNLSTVIAFSVPKGKFNGFMIAAAHSDSPTFRIKSVAENDTGKYVLLNTEKYGGMIYSSWLDRPLSVAGKVIIDCGDKIVSRLINIEHDFLMIPSAAIHMNRKANDGYVFNPAVDLQPLMSSGNGKGDFYATIAEAAGVKEEILGTDLMLYNRQKGIVWGHDGEFISAPRLDDLQCAFALTQGFLAAENCGSMPVCCIFDNEEVGSGTKQGAKSMFLTDLLRRINNELGRSETDYKKALAGSLMVSADNAHAVHPNHPEFADKSKSPYMNEGIVIKYNANQKYTTDAVSEAMFKRICTEAGVPVQVFANRADMVGGSTLGNLAVEKVPVNCVDIGLPQLAMHSSYETAGTNDTEYLIKAMKLFFEKTITPIDSGSYKI